MRPSLFFEHLVAVWAGVFSFPGPGHHRQPTNEGGRWPAETFVSQRRLPARSASDATTRQTSRGETRPTGSSCASTAAGAGSTPRTKRRVSEPRPVAKTRAQRKAERRAREAARGARAPERRRRGGGAGATPRSRSRATSPRSRRSSRPAPSPRSSARRSARPTSPSRSPSHPPPRAPTSAPPQRAAESRRERKRREREEAARQGGAPQGAREAARRAAGASPRPRNRLPCLLLGGVEASPVADPRDARTGLRHHDRLHRGRRRLSWRARRGLQLARPAHPLTIHPKREKT